METKKIFLFLLLGFFFMSFASAAWDDGDYVLTDQTYDLTDTTTFNYTGLNFSDYENDRMLVIGISGGAVSSVLVNGDAATEIIEHTESAATASIYTATPTTGSGYIEITYTASTIRSSVSIWALYGIQDEDAHDTYGGLADSQPDSFDVNMPENGIVIVRTQQGGSKTITSSNINIDFNQAYGATGTRYSGLSGDSVTADPTFTISNTYNVDPSADPNAVVVAATFTYSALTGPDITLDAPANDYISGETLVQFNTTVTDPINVENVTLVIDGVINQTNSSGFNGTYTFPVKIPDGDHNWSIFAYNNQSLKSESVTRNFTVDTSGPLISIESPDGFIQYHMDGNNLTLNTTVTDANLDTCWYDYNGTNNTFSCTSGVKATILFNSVYGLNSLDVYANDTAGSVSKESTSWDYFMLETDRVYDPNTVQTATEQFILVLEKDSSITSSSATLTYNGGTYTSIRTSSGNQVNFTNSIGIPTSLSGSIPFYWTVSYTNSTGTYSFNTTSSNQTVYNLTLTQCFAPTLDGLTLNFTTYDSTNMTVLNSTLEATFQFFSTTGSGELIAEYLFSDLNENRSNYMYCLESNGENVTVDAFISYGATDHDNREYIINDGIIGNFTQSIPLYLTLTELTDIVTITVQDQNYDPIQGALVAIQRWNIGTNTYSTIGMFTTSSSGQGIMDLELYTTWYRAVVYVDGEIVKVTDVQKLSSTSWVINVEVGVDNPYDLFGNIVSGVTFDNETNITSFTWIDSSGYASRGCLIVLNHTTLGDVEISNSCVDSVSGTIDYLIVGEGSFTAYGIIYLEGYNQSQIVDSLEIQIGVPAITETVSPYGKVISFLVIGTMGGIGVAAGSAILGGALIIVGLIALMKWGFLNITWGFVWGIISIVILIWVLQRRKR